MKSKLLFNDSQQHTLVRFHSAHFSLDSLESSNSKGLFEVVVVVVADCDARESLMWHKLC